MASTLTLLLQLLLVSLASAELRYGGTATVTYRGMNPDGTFKMDFRYRDTFDTCQSGQTWSCLKGQCGSLSSLERGFVGSSSAAPLSQSFWCEAETVERRNIPSDKPFEMWANSCCWINTRNAVSSWRLLTFVDLGTRSDTREPNRSPDIAVVPFLRVPYNCPRTYKLVHFDPDGDKVRCRYGNFKDNECSKCDRPSGFFLDQDSCTLQYNTGAYDQRPFGLEIMVEDFPRSLITVAYSDGSLSFRAPAMKRRKRQVISGFSPHSHYPQVPLCPPNWYDVGFSYDPYETSTTPTKTKTTTPTTTIPAMKRRKRQILSGSNHDPNFPHSHSPQFPFCPPNWYDVGFSYDPYETSTTPTKTTTPTTKIPAMKRKKRQILSGFNRNSIFPLSHYPKFPFYPYNWYDSGYAYDPYETSTTPTTTVPAAKRRKRRKFNWPTTTTPTTTVTYIPSPYRPPITTTTATTTTTPTTTTITTTVPAIQALPLSKLPLHFSLLVDDSVPSCELGQYLPKYLYPTPENGVHIGAEVNKEVEIRVKAEASFSQIQNVSFSGPQGITRTQISNNEFALKWTPGPDDLGQHYVICFVVESRSGSRNYHSDMRCVIVDVRQKTVEANVICSQSEMRVEVDRSAFPGLSEDHLRLSDPSNVVCSLKTHSNSSHIIAVSPLNTCGTQIEEDDDYLFFKNEITTFDNSQLVITRKQLLEVQFYCQYPKRGDVTQSFRAHRNPTTVWEKGMGRFTYQFEFFPDAMFQTEFEPNSYPLEINIGSRIHMQIQATSQVPDTRLFVEACKASPYDNPNSKPVYILLRHGCNVDPTIQIHPQDNPMRLRFSVEAFKFIGLQDQVYITCSVLVCRAGDPNTRCSQGCDPSSQLNSSPYGRRKRAGVTQSSLHYVSQGPLRALRSKRSLSPVISGDLNVIFIAGCLLAAVGVISGATVYVVKMSKMKYQPLPTQEI